MNESWLVIHIWDASRIPNPMYRMRHNYCELPVYNKYFFLIWICPIESRNVFRLICFLLIYCRYIGNQYFFSDWYRMPQKLITYETFRYRTRSRNFISNVQNVLPELQASSLLPFAHPKKRYMSAVSCRE